MSNNSVGAYCHTSLNCDSSPRRSRRSIRLQRYDYTRGGAYFVTICTQNRECLFGNVVNGQMVLNDAGRIVVNVWINTPELRPNVKLDEFVVMPNHFHGIVVIVEPCRGVLHYKDIWHGGVWQYAPTEGQPDQSNTSKMRSPSQTLGAIIRGFKSAATKRINESRDTPVKIWQRNYYEHIIRHDDEFNRIREYISVNPARWETDRENPSVGAYCHTPLHCNPPPNPWEGEK
jgi:putative transposase